MELLFVDRRPHCLQYRLGLFDVPVFFGDRQLASCALFHEIDDLLLFGRSGGWHIIGTTAHQITPKTGARIARETHGLPQIPVVSGLRQAWELAFLRRGDRSGNQHGSSFRR